MKFHYCIVFQMATYDPLIIYQIDFEVWTNIKYIEVHYK